MHSITFQKYILVVIGILLSARSHEIYCSLTSKVKKTSPKVYQIILAVIPAATELDDGDSFRAAFNMAAGRDTGRSIRLSFQPWHQPSQ
jgi:hypothetical protein